MRSQQEYEDEIAARHILFLRRKNYNIILLLCFFFVFFFSVSKTVHLRSLGQTAFLTVLFGDRTDLLLFFGHRLVGYEVNKSKLLFQIQLC